MKNYPLSLYEHRKKLDGSSIDEPRVNPKVATNVLIHIGGTYSIFGYDYLGGSYGCFGYIPKENVYSSADSAKQASVMMIMMIIFQILAG